MQFSMRSALLVLAIFFCARSARAGVIPIAEVFEPPAPANPARFGKIAVLQWNPSQPTPVGVTVADAERAKQANRSQIEAFVRAAAAKGAKMVITPEFGVVGYPY